MKNRTRRLFGLFGGLGYLPKNHPYRLERAYQLRKQKRVGGVRAVVAWLDNAVHGIWLS